MTTVDIAAALVHELNEGGFVVTHYQDTDYIGARIQGYDGSAWVYVDADYFRVHINKYIIGMSSTNRFALADPDSIPRMITYIDKWLQQPLLDEI